METYLSAIWKTRNRIPGERVKETKGFPERIVITRGCRFCGGLFFLRTATKTGEKYTINIEGNKEEDEQGGVESVETREELAKRASKGDREAFGMLYQEVYRDLYRFACYVLRDSYEAQDLVAETVADAWETISRLRRPEAFQAWIFKILSNKCKRKLKEIGENRRRLSEEETGFSQDMDRNLQVREAFFRLEAEERMIVALKVFGGYKSQEIGDLLHKSHNTVRSRYSRALKKMEKYLD